MTPRIQIPINTSSGFEDQLKRYASLFPDCCILDSGSGSAYTYPGTARYECVVAFKAREKQTAPAGKAFDTLLEFHRKHGDWLFGHLGYDLKNETENLSSENPANEQFPDLSFFIPQWLFIRRSGTWTAHINPRHREELNDLLKKIQSFTVRAEQNPAARVQPRISKSQYVRRVLSLKHHIQIGDIYEANFCQDFTGNVRLTNPYRLYSELRSRAATPFGGFYRCDSQYLMCASPERFLRKTGEDIISQPMKGTAKRGSDPEEDNARKKALYEDEKERAENVMIVDLVRNDLSRTAARQSVKVNELFGIYTFPGVHQMISTVSSKVKKGVPFTDVLKYAFPPGSMTGAPKIKAMKLIEKYEGFKRGLYSGSLGYITPDADFDFNVVIRSILYDADHELISFPVGGAITDLCDPDKEYEESLLKAEMMLKVLG